MHDAHAFAAAAMGGFDHQRKADVPRLLQKVFRALVIAAIARNDRYAVCDHQGFRTGLGTHGAHTGGFRPDEHDTCGADHFGEFGILREEAVAGVDGLGLGGQGRIQHGLLVQITQAGFGRPDEYRLIGQTDMFGVTIGFGKYRHGPDAERMAGTDDPAGDFAAVGNQYFAEQGLHSGLIQAAGRFSRNAPRPSCPSLPTRSEAISRALALSWFSICRSVWAWQ